MKEISTNIEMLKSYVSSLSDEQRGAVYWTSALEGKSEEELQLGLMALVGVDTYLNVYKADSRERFDQLSVDIGKFLPAAITTREVALAEAAAERLVQDNNVTKCLSAYENANNASSEVKQKEARLEAMIGLVQSISTASGLGKVTIQVAGASQNYGAYVEMKTPSVFSLSFSSDGIVWVPSPIAGNNDGIVFANMLTGNYTLYDLVRTLAHEVTHIRQVTIQNNQLHGETSDLGTLLVANSQRRITMEEHFGEYMAQTAEAHANCFSIAFTNFLKKKGALK